MAFQTSFIDLGGLILEITLFVGINPEEFLAMKSYTFPVNLRNFVQYSESLVYLYVIFGDNRFTGGKKTIEPLSYTFPLIFMLLIINEGTKNNHSDQMDQHFPRLK